MKTVETVNYHGLICLDGPDATGKTTLANKIAEMTGGEVIHLTWTPRLAENMNMYRTAAIQYAAALAGEKVVILERPWLCHAVYSDVYRGGDYNERDLLTWKYLAEGYEVMSITALPRDFNEWQFNYRKMCALREELHGADLEAMGRVYNRFNHAIMVRTELQPGVYAGANFEIYDYQQWPEPEAFVEKFILPNLPTWSKTNAKDQ